MFLARVLNEGEDELICDFAQVYHCYNYESLPLKTAAALCSGLPADSRTVRRLTGQKYSAEQTMLMHIFDRVNWLCWAQTKDAAHGRNKPQSIFDRIEEKRQMREQKESIKAFDSAAAFEACRKSLAG